MKAIRVGFVVLTVVVFSRGANHVVGAPIKIVAPSMYADIEADSYAWPPPIGRYQQVFVAADFESLPDARQTISQMAWRPDGQLSAPLITTWDNVIIRLSTTRFNPPNLSMTFASNIGGDETEVFSGPLTISTANIGPSGGPKEFDQVIPFHTPFEYDPSAGNLLLDMTWFGVSAPQSIDYISSIGPDIQTVHIDDSAVPTAGGTSGGPVVQWTFTSQPLLGDLNLDGEVNGLDVDPFVDVLLNGPFQLEADMNEDQLVNGLDVDPFVAVVVGDSAEPIPEPSTLLLASIALGVVSGWRKWGAWTLRDKNYKKASCVRSDLGPAA